MQFFLIKLGCWSSRSSDLCGTVCSSQPPQPFQRWSLSLFQNCILHLQAFVNVWSPGGRSLCPWKTGPHFSSPDVPGCQHHGKKGCVEWVPAWELRGAVGHSSGFWGLQWVWVMCCEESSKGWEKMIRKEVWDSGIPVLPAAASASFPFNFYGKLSTSVLLSASVFSSVK